MASKFEKDVYEKFEQIDKFKQEFPVEYAVELNQLIKKVFSSSSSCFVKII